MSSKVIGVFLICLISVTTFSAFHLIAPVKAAAPQIEFFYHYGFYMEYPVGSYGVYNVIGEVENVGNAPASQVNITVTYLNWQGVPLNTTNAQTYVRCVLPGRKVPFRQALSGPNAPLIVNYTVAITTVIQGDGKPFSLQVVNSTYYTKTGVVIVPGTVRNNGVPNALSTQVLVSYYNKSTGNIFWASKTYASSSNLSYAETTRFEVSSQPLTIAPEKCLIDLVAESEEYLSQPSTTNVQDTIMPQIGAATWSPSSPTSSQIVTVNVNVTKPDYTSKVTKVTLHYKVEGGQPKQIDLTASGNRWSTPNLPKMGPFGAGQIVVFYVVAFDDAGKNVTSSVYNFTVQGQAQSVGVPAEVLLIAFIVLILLGVVYKFRKRLF